MGVSGWVVVLPSLFSPDLLMANAWTLETRVCLLAKGRGWLCERDRDRETEMERSLPLTNTMSGGAGLWPEGRDADPYARQKER